MFVSSSTPPPLPPKTAPAFDVGNWLCTPLAPLIPSRVHPNHITAANAVVSVLVVLCGALSASFDQRVSEAQQQTQRPLVPYFRDALGAMDEQQARWWRAATLVACGVGNLATMALDCLDGIHARRTKQTSKLGEFLDHWSDSLSVCHIVGVILLACRFDYIPAAFASTMFISCLVYNSELVLFHHRGVFLHTSGVEGQLILSAILFAWAYVQPAYGSAFHSNGLLAIAALPVIGGGHAVYGFWRYFYGPMTWHMVKYILLNLAPIALFMAGAISPLAAIYVFAGLSFRVNGSLVLYSLAGAKASYPGHCNVALAWMVALLLVNMANPFALSSIFGPSCDWSLQEALPYVFFAHMSLLNGADLKRRFGVLVPVAAAASSGAAHTSSH